MFAYTALHRLLANHEREDAVALSWPSLCRYRLSTHMLAVLRVDNVDKHCILERHYLFASIAVQVGAPRREIYIPFLGVRSRCCILFSLPPELSNYAASSIEAFHFYHRAVDQPGLLPVNHICILFL